MLSILAEPVLALRSVRFARSARGVSRFGSHLVRRRSPRKNASALFSSLRRRAKRASDLLAPLAAFRALEATSFVGVRRGKTPRLSSPHYGGARNGRPICSLRSRRFALWKPPRSSAFAEEKRLGSLLLTTAARETGVRFARSARGVSRFGSHLVRRRSPRKNASALFSSLRRRAK